MLQVVVALCGVPIDRIQYPLEWLGFLHLGGTYMHSHSGHTDLHSV